MNKINNNYSLVSKENLSTKKIGRLLISVHGYNYFQSIPALVSFRREANNCERIVDIVELCFRKFSNFPYKYLEWGIYPLQVKEEMLKLLKIIVCQKPKFILEIGTARGGTLFSFLKIMNQNGILISIDLPGGRFGGGYSAWRVPFYKSFVTNAQRVFLLRADSHSTTTLNRVKKILNGRKLDFLFLDGDHSYDGIKRDFEMYRNLVDYGGIIAFHDICSHPPHIGCEVDRFWLSIKNEFASCELINNPEQGWAGIGVIFL